VAQASTLRPYQTAISHINLFLEIRTPPDTYYQFVGLFIDLEFKGMATTWPQFLWWWEIGGLSVSIICCGLLILFLAWIDQMSIELWSLWIQPNTAIAILATFTKASMMVPVASCISQLKWWLFRKEQRPLGDLDLVDDASRGPWGAFVLLFKLPRSSIVISLLALITIINLGVEPSAQQVLETRVRLSKLANASAVVGVATAYESKGLRPPGMYTIGRN
jgi:hypothetical protein